MGITTQNDVTNALTTAMQAIAESNVRSKEATLVVEAEVVEVIDEGLGTYRVKYLGNKFDATTAHTEITYEIGDMVYVIIPNGNFDKNKVILSPVTPSSATYASTQGESSYITLGDNLFKTVNNVNLCTYKPTTKTVGVDSTGFAALFNAALTDSRVFNFTCKIRTNIEKSRRTKGNYGLILSIPVIQSINGVNTSKRYELTIDVNNITGDPYDLEVPSLQNFYFTLPDDMIYNNNANPTIKAFVKDFIGTDNTKPDDIFITDIKLLSTLEISEETMSGYFAVVTADGGNSFLASRTGDTKTLTVTAYYNGKVTKINNFDCYWFKENVTINTTSDKFQRFGGLGWEILNDVSEKSIAEDGKITYQYVTNVYSQVVSQTDIHCDTKFKCVLVKGENVVSNTIVIKNLASDALVELTSLTGSTSFPIGIGNVNLQLKYYESGITNVDNPDFVVGYAWQRLDKKGNYIDSDFYIIDEFNRKENNTFYTKIHYPVNEIDEVNTIFCTVYVDTPSADNNSVNRLIIGTVKIVLTTNEFANGRIIAINGDKLYKYDADGDSPMVADYDGPLSSAIKTIDPIEITLFKEDGTELTSDEYKVVDIKWLVPIDSMITLTASQKTDTTTNPGYYTISGKYPVNNKLSYGISNTYNKNKLDNTILIQATAPPAVLKEKVTEAVNLRFLKDGEGGTNGSKYSAILTYEGYGYGEKDGNGKVHKLQLVYVADNGTWYLYNPANPTTFTQFTSVTLVPYLYVDGVYASGYISQWDLFDKKYNNANDKILSPISVNGGVLSLNGNKWTDSTKNFCTTIEVRVGISNTSFLTKSEEYVYAYYPIECSYVSNYVYLKSFVPSLEGGFSKVLYASDGTNPQYDNSEPFSVANPQYDDIDSLYEYSWSASSNMKISEINRSKCKITPLSKYDNGVAKNFVRVDITRTPSETNELTQRKNDLTNQRTAITNRKNYYQTLQNNLDIFGNFQYNNYIDTLTQASEFYLVKTNLTKTIEQLTNQINDVLTLSNEYKQTEVGTDDPQVINLYNEVNTKITKLSNLSKICAQLGAVAGAVNQILTYTPSSLVITKKIIYEGIPSRSCYFTINDSINTYNNTVNTIYTTYLNSLNNTQIINYETTVRTVINNLKTFVQSSKLTNLGKTYYTCNEEAYRYNSLKKVLTSIVNSASAQLDTYSYNLVIANIINPMYDSLSWYISFYSGGGYTSLITEINNQINALTNEINILSNMLLPGNSVTIYHVKPIIMVYNRYELSHINGWDGNKLEIGNEEGYIIAPQVGAGRKDNNNRFTGIVIGVKQVQEKSSSNQKIGLFGYSSGVQSIFLNAENGSAIFGISGKGQVIIDPSTDEALIKSGNYSISERTGMQINLSAPEIRFGSGNFVVDNTGKVIAAGGGSIAGWDIDDTTIHSKISVIDGRLVLDSGAIVTGYNTKGEKVYTATNPGKIYTGNHNTLSSTNKGLYLSQDGLSICNGSRSRIELSTEGDPIIYSGNHDTLSSTNKGFYLGQNGFSICNENRSRIELTTYGDPIIYSGNHDTLSATTKGFYLGQNGFSISNEGQSRIELSTEGNPVIYSGKHSSLNSDEKGFYLGQDGFSISNSGRSRIEINTEGDPVIYSSEHNSLDSKKAGFYLGRNGLSIGSKVYIDSTGVLRLGHNAVESSGSCWTINGSSYSSSISYGIEGTSGSVYIGTDKITLGETFSVNNRGHLKATDAELSGKIEANSGNIAGWKIEGSSLVSENGHFKIDSEGYFNLVGQNAYIDLSGWGSTYPGCHLNANNIVLNSDCIAVTEYKGSWTISPGTTAEIIYKGSDNANHYLKFLHGILISST